MYRVYLIVGFLLGLYSCSDSGDKSSKHFDVNSNIKDYKSKVKDINIDPLVSEIATIAVFKDYFVLHDLQAGSDRVTHLFNRDNFSHVVNAVVKGGGPGEVTVPGELSFEPKENSIWVTDLGKMLVWKFPLDSILSNPNYKAEQSMKMNMEKFIYKFSFLDKENTLGKAMSLQQDRSIAYRVAKSNLKTGNVEDYGYFPKDIKGQQSEFNMKISLDDGLYVMAYYWKDLVTVCSIDGNLNFNLYGKNWQSSKKKVSYFNGVDIFKNKIIASYTGVVYKKLDENKQEVVVRPKKLVVFDIEGKYIETLDIGHEIIDFCADEKNNRIIFYFADKEKAFGYIDYQ